MDREPSPVELRVLSLGGGVQSSTVLLMSIAGDLPRLDAAIFADTGWEPKAVYRHLDWLEGVARAGGLPVYRVTAGNLRDDVIESVGSGDPVGSIGQTPLYVRDDPHWEDRRPAREGRLWRKCTKGYKLEPIRCKVGELLGDRPKRPGVVEQWIGISWGERRRCRDSGVKYITNRFPLVESGMTRLACLEWLERHGFPEPPKSACLGCPFHNDAYWCRLKAESPREWHEVVAWDAAIRRGIPGVRGEAFVHRSLVPLEQVDLRDDVDRGQGTLPGFERECTGHCGV